MSFENQGYRWKYNVIDRSARNTFSGGFIFSYSRLEGHGGEEWSLDFPTALAL